jgi:hypothetical protein
MGFKSLAWQMIFALRYGDELMLDDDVSGTANGPTPAIASATIIYSCEMMMMVRGECDRGG